MARRVNWRWWVAIPGLILLSPAIILKVLLVNLIAAAQWMNDFLSSFQDDTITRLYRWAERGRE